MPALLVTGRRELVANSEKGPRQESNRDGRTHKKAK